MTVKLTKPNTQARVDAILGMGGGETDSLDVLHALLSQAPEDTIFEHRGGKTVNMDTMRKYLWERGLDPR